MRIIKDGPLIYSNLYIYDVRACGYNILRSIGWDVNGINYEDKNTRVVQIGLLQRDNPTLNIYINKVTSYIMEYYIKTNDLSENDVIIRTKDGIVTNKKIKNIKNTMPIELRNIISKLIITIDRSAYMAICMNGDVVVKGIKNRTIDTSFYDLFKNIDFGTKKSILFGLESIRRVVLSSDKIEWFVKEENDKLIMPLIYDDSVITINKSSLNFIDHNEIDKSFVWKDLIWPFAETLTIHCHSKQII